MLLEEIYEYCNRKPFVSEGFPFDASTLVFKVGSKMFALLDVDHFDSINLKCEPDQSIELREMYDGIQPGYHMNKKHWNTVSANADVPNELLKELIDISYNLVFLSLTKKERHELEMG
ncbi:MAG: MmcQ/YjbR family DNA-binding protein [Crocinitomicaceae bacterium]|nr:MmcQ/YjbR family DNA-binding protein [Crocinitomicaceae bacterium]